MNVSDTAETLGLTEQTVETRLFRAHSIVRNQISKDLGQNFSGIYPFMNERCYRVVENVMARILKLRDN